HYALRYGWLPMWAKLKAEGVDATEASAGRMRWLSGLGSPGRGLWLAGVGRLRVVPVAGDGPGLIEAGVVAALRHPLFAEDPAVTSLGGKAPEELRLGLLETFDELL